MHGITSIEQVWDDQALIEEVVDHNTTEKNIVCCIEEMSELIKVLTKRLRSSSKFTTEKLTEELAHVLLMCNVVADEYGISYIDIYKEQQDAVKRMKEEE
jgi:NTP pyrophosphatase (non-canonical NTP hydrolase)